MTSQPGVTDPGQDPSIARGHPFDPVADLAVPQVVPVQQGLAVVSLGNRGIVQVDASLLELLPERDRPLAIGLE